MWENTQEERCAAWEILFLSHCSMGVFLGYTIACRVLENISWGLKFPPCYKPKGNGLGSFYEEECNFALCDGSLLFQTV